jgi:hypothetical protein
MSYRRWVLVLAVLGLSGAVLLAGETAGVSGSSTQYPTAVEATVNDKPVKLTLTGVALRKRLVFNVYTIGSYVQEGSGVRTAEQLEAADVPKQLDLTMERDIDGADLASAFKDAIRLNYQSPAFESEVNNLEAFLKSMAVKRGDQLKLTHVPGVGFHGVLVGGNKEVFIKNPNFSRAVWSIYLGENNIGAEIKQALVSRL